MQNHVVDLLLADLRALIRDLGRDGGLIGPSIYDTAQVLRLAPPATGIQQALDWLAAQQQPDGGWGDPAIPRARDVPTLAAVLALRMYALTPGDHQVVQVGVAFLRRHMHIWEGALPDELPVGIELLLPRLLDEAEAAGLIIPRQPYASVIALGRQRRRMIAQVPLRAGTPPVHTWEGWGEHPELALLDGYGSVGHSPAATAAWMRATASRTDLAEQRHAAHRYLEQAARATGVAIPGVVPTAWPITRFEQSFALYGLLIGGLLDHPGLRDMVQPQLDKLARAMRSTGIGFSDEFAADGDDTAVALAVLQASGYAIDLDVLERFAHGSHFCAYAGELQPSLSVTAHAAHTLGLRNPSTVRSHAYLIERQLPDGRWCDDKWNGSWLYTTSQVLIALLGTPTQYGDTVERALAAVLAHQHTDGGWGPLTQVSNGEETAYAILALRAAGQHGMGGSALAGALERAEQWMLEHYRPFYRGQHRAWLAKENYRPERIVRMLELVAAFPSTELPIPLQMAQSVGGALNVVASQQSSGQQNLQYRDA
jgi:hypothetical protein